MCGRQEREGERERIVGGGRFFAALRMTCYGA